jgi:hypothetical protein
MRYCLTGLGAADTRFHLFDQNVFELNPSSVSDRFKMYMLKTAGVDFNFRLPDSDNLHSDAEAAATFQVFERAAMFDKTVVREDSSVR